MCNDGLERACALVSCLVEGQERRNGTGRLRRKRWIKTWGKKREELCGKHSVSYFFPDPMASSKGRIIVDIAAISGRRDEILERWRTRRVGKHLNHPRANNARIVRKGVWRMQRAEEHRQDCRHNQDCERFCRAHAVSPQGPWVTIGFIATLLISSAARVHHCTTASTPS